METNKLMITNIGLRSIVKLCRAALFAVTLIALSLLFNSPAEAQIEPPPTEPPQQTTANVTIGVVTIPEEATGTVSVTLTNAGNGLSDFQGRLIYDSSVVSVREVNGLEGYTIAAFQIDNFEGEARFIGFKSSGDLLSNGEFLEFTVQSLGDINASSSLDMEFITFNDNTGPITHIVTPGRVTVGARSPLIADFSFSPSNPEIDDEIQFSDTSRGGSEVFENWIWDFGDGETSTEQNPTHAFTTPGNFTVTLTVTDDVGTEATTSQTVTILPPGGADIITVHNYPNPARESTTFSYFVPTDSTQALISVYAFTGPLVFTRAIDVNNIELTWNLQDNNGDSLPNGLYLYRIWASTPDGARISEVGKLVIRR